MINGLDDFQVFHDILDELVTGWTLFLSIMI